ncbi:MAG: hypothetical protein QNJ40_23505 [Xanthomonadales bacterium]|nr:hypothetical protein [Xanthomonadales bacterium]
MRTYSKAAVWLFTAVVLLVSSPAAAQLRIAFTGKDANAPDEYAFVALNDISSGTSFFVTNCDWDNSTGAFINPCNEGVMQVTTTAVITRGTVTLVQETAPDVYTVTGDATAVAVPGSLAWQSVSADPHYAFAASNPTSPLNTVTEIYAYADTDPDTAVGGVKDPTINNNASPNAVVLDFVGVQPVGMDFVGNRSTATLADLTNTANYTVGGTITLDLTAFTGPGLPVELKSFSVE